MTLRNLRNLIFIFTLLGHSLGAAGTAMECATSLADLNGLTVNNYQVSKQPSQAQKVVTDIFEEAGVHISGSSTPDLVVNDPKFYSRLLSDPTLQIGETYMDGMWDSSAIDDISFKLMTQLQKGRIKSLLPVWRTPDLAFLSALKYGYRYYRDLLINRQNRTRSSTVAKEHYDVGNELYRRMLDPTLTYTSGVWAPGFTLEDAQNAKYDLIARKLGLKPGDRVLDIGSGFGGFARFASKFYRAKVTGITISVEQLKVAQSLSADYKDVDFLFSDYRDIPLYFAPNTFDHVVSIEMIEAVGPKNLKDYFDSASFGLKAGGKFVIQGIAKNNDAVNTNAWFSKYIFHDGVAPSSKQLDKAAAKTFGHPIDRQNITEDYDKTLMAWHENFSRAWPDLKNKYSERFKRMWDFYLLSVAGDFRARAMQLYQTVYIKGPHQNENLPIRDFPTRERLNAMRATDRQIEKTAIEIGDLENKKNKTEEAKVLRPSRPNKPLATNAKILIVGAGPGGLSAGLKLQNMGYKNITVVEKESESGGKSHTMTFAGRPHDMGATMGVKLKYKEIERLATEQGQVTVPFPKQVYYDLETGRPLPKRTFKESSKFIYQGLLYLIHHTRMVFSGERGLEVPPPELADPWQVTLGRLGLDYFADQTSTYLTGYGYGGPETPAVYGERMFDANAIIGAALSPPIMWQNGSQPIWQGVARQLNVHTNTEIERIERNENGVYAFIKGENNPTRYDKVIMAVDPSSTLKILDTTDEERSLYSLVQYTPYATFAVRVEGFSEGKSQVGYIKENMSLDREGRPMAWIKRYADDNIFIFHLFAPQSLSDEHIMANITQDMNRLGATKLTLVDSKRWPFFPHVDSNAMREDHFFERVSALQGQNHTVFVNEAIGMSTMPDSADLGKKVAQRLASGEY